MATEMLLRNVAPTLYVSALQSAWRAGAQIYDPSIWLYREPEIDEKMMRDADIAHVIGYRTHLIAGPTWNIRAAVEKDVGADLAAEVATSLVQNIRNFTQSRRMLSMAFLSGARYAEIRGEYRTLTIGDGKPREWWVPTQLKDMDKRRFRLVRDDWGQHAHEDNPQHRHVEIHWEYWSVEAEEWVILGDEEERRLIKNVYMDDESSLGHGRGLRDALGWWWYAKEHTFQESLEAVERFAQGILTAKIDGLRDANTLLPNETLVRKWMDVLEDMRARHILVFDKEDEIEVVRMGGEGWQLLTSIREELKNTIFSLVLAANLPTGGGDGETGSYGKAAIQENSTETLVQFDREILEESIRDDLVGYLWWKNWRNITELGLTEQPLPRFDLMQEKQEDPEKAAGVATQLLQSGVNLVASDVYEKTGFKQPEDGDELIEGQQAPPDPFGGAGGGAPPQGQGFPGAGEPAEFGDDAAMRRWDAEEVQGRGVRADGDGATFWLDPATGQTYVERAGQVTLFGSYSVRIPDRPEGQPRCNEGQGAASGQYAPQGCPGGGSEGTQTPDRGKATGGNYVEISEVKEKRKYDRKAPDYEVDSLSTYIRKSGGIQWSEEYEGELKGWGKSNIVRKSGGLSVGRAMEEARNGGYIGEDATEAEFLDALDDDLRGNPRYSSNKDWGAQDWGGDEEQGPPQPLDWLKPKDDGGDLSSLEHHEKFRYMGVEITYDENKKNEASNTPDGIVVGPSWVALDDAGREVIITHEVGHDLSDMMLVDQSAFELQDAGAFNAVMAIKDEFGVERRVAVDGINGQTTPGENAAEAYAQLIHEPAWLKKNYPKAYTAIRERALREGFPVGDAPVWTAPEPEDAIPFTRDGYREEDHPRDEYGKWTDKDLVTEIQAAYQGVASVAEGRRVRGFTDQKSEADKARKAGLDVKRVVGQGRKSWWVYGEDKGGELADHLVQLGYGGTFDERVRLSELAGYSEKQIEAFSELIRRRTPKQAEEFSRIAFGTYSIRFPDNPENQPRCDEGQPTGGEWGEQDCEGGGGNTGAGSETPGRTWNMETGKYDVKPRRDGKRVGWPDSPFDPLEPKPQPEPEEKPLVGVRGQVTTEGRDRLVEEFKDNPLDDEDLKERIRGRLKGAGVASEHLEQATAGIFLAVQQARYGAKPKPDEGIPSPDESKYNKAFMAAEKGIEDYEQRERVKSLLATLSKNPRNATAQEGLLRILQGSAGFGPEYPGFDEVAAAVGIYNGRAEARAGGIAVGAKFMLNGAAIEISNVDLDGTVIVLDKKTGSPASMSLEDFKAADVTAFEYKMPGGLKVGDEIDYLGTKLTIGEVSPDGETIKILDKHHSAEWDIASFERRVARGNVSAWREAQEAGPMPSDAAERPLGGRIENPAMHPMNRNESLSDAMGMASTLIEEPDFSGEGWKKNFKQRYRDKLDYGKLEMAATQARNAPWKDSALNDVFDKATALAEGGGTFTEAAQHVADAIGGRIEMTPEREAWEKFADTLVTSGYGIFSGTEAFDDLKDQARTTDGPQQATLQAAARDARDLIAQERDRFMGGGGGGIKDATRMQYTLDRASGLREPSNVKGSDVTAKAWGEKTSAAQAANPKWDKTYDGTRGYIEAIGGKAVHIEAGYLGRGNALDASKKSVQTKLRNAYGAFGRGVSRAAESGFVPEGFSPTVIGGKKLVKRGSNTQAFFSTNWKMSGLDSTPMGVHIRYGMTEKEMKAAASDGWTEGDELKDSENLMDILAIHETGHAIHRHNIGAGEWRSMLNDYNSSKVSGADLVGFSDEEKWALSGLPDTELTQYGRTHVAELVAETYTRMVLGKPVDPEVMRAYRAHGGYVPE